VRARLLADADLRIAIVRGLQRSEPQLDFLAPQGQIPDSTSDPGVLALAATLGRVLVSYDFKTMPGQISPRAREVPFAEIVFMAGVAPHDGRERRFLGLPPCKSAAGAIV